MFSSITSLIRKANAYFYSSNIEIEKTEQLKRKKQEIKNGAQYEKIREKNRKTEKRRSTTTLLSRQ